MIVYDLTGNFKEAGNEWNADSGYYWIVSDARNIAEVTSWVELDKECVEECKNLKQSAKITFFRDYTFIVFNILEYGISGIFSRELNIFLGKNYIITVYKDHSDIIEELLTDIRNSRNCFILGKFPHPSILLYYILDRIIVRNYNIISDLEARADKIEISILKKPRKEKAHALIELRSQVYKTRKFLNPLRYIGDSIIMNDNEVVELEFMKYFESINRKIDKLMLSMENLVQALALAREAFESETANQTNDLMKVFTLITAIFLPLDLLSSLFGMSFDYMPLKDHIYGYYIILILMVFIVLYLIYKFKKNKWL